MRFARLILVLTLCLAVLPWGAWTGAAAAAAAGQQAMVAVTLGGDGRDAAPPAPEAVRVALPSLCHGPVLPGAPCLGDHALPQTALTPVGPRDGADIRPLRATATPRGRSPSVPIQPPRSA